MAALALQYRIDPARVYASGFSNGTNMALQFLGDPMTPFSAYALVEGGLFVNVDGDPPHGPFGADAPRIYATTGYRDYIYDTMEDLFEYLTAHQYPDARLWARQTDSAHELYGWDYVEFFSWMDQGKKPGPSGTLSASWTRETAFTSTDGLTHMASGLGGVVVATGTGGDLWQRSAAGAWTQSAHIDSTIPVYTDLCIQPSGHGIAIGQQGAVAETTNGGATWSATASVPEYDTEDFGFSYLTSVACSSTNIVGGGLWSAAISSNGGQSWKAGSMSNDGYPAQVATVAVSAAGTWIAGGYYDYIGRSTDGTTFTLVSPTGPIYQWYTGVASAPGGQWWIVGEEGAILHSTDDGMTWVQQVSPVSDDFYAVAFANAQVGIAVGRVGQAVVTTNGGSTWEDVSTGLNVFLSGAVWLDAQTALVGGEAGTVLQYHLK